VAVLVSSLAAVLVLFVALMQYHQTFKTETSMLVAGLFGFVMIVVLAVAITHPKEVSSIMGPEHPTPASSAPIFTLPTVVITNDETRPTKNDAGNGSIQPRSVQNPLSISVPSTMPWTQTNVLVKAGQVVTITAKGKVVFSDHDPLTGPEGQGRACDPPRHGYFPAPALSCHSLIGQSVTKSLLKSEVQSNFVPQHQVFYF
jgi:hypothetical protein